MANFYYGTVPALAWILGHHFYGGKHYMWLAEEYYPYRLLNPKSSNPHLIYQNLYQPWKDQDDHDKDIQQVRIQLRKGVIAQAAGSTPSITLSEEADLKAVCDGIDIVFLYPVVYRVDIDRIPVGRRKAAGSALKGSSEYLIEALDESEIDAILFLDFDGDADFKTLLVDELAAPGLNRVDALRILKRR